MTRPPLRIPVVVPVLFGIALFIVATILSQIERPPMHSTQRGVRGTGAASVENPRTMASLLRANQIPPSVPYAGGVGPKAGEFYKNVKVLGDVDHGEFTRLMVNMTTWVAPDKGCAACHNVADFADDSLYTKVVSRRMLEMVRYINTTWTPHVAKTGVTCYTCHRGKLVPPNVWFNNPGPAQAHGVSQIPAGQNHPSAIVAGSSLPFDPFTPFLEKDDELRVQRLTPLPKAQGVSIKQAEWTYALMLNMSESLGVNCNFCHVSRTFGVWNQNPPQRVTAWHGIRMVRDLNQNYLNPLNKLLPRERLGPALGDAPKANCATCHNGVHKPLFGVSMVQNFPELISASAQGAPPPR
jgi:photosynthetic reaction center cytochrome c subunit